MRSKVKGEKLRVVVVEPAQKFINFEQWYKIGMPVDAVALILYLL